ncbi:hypothetical protein [Psychroserpens algicola]|uniref:Uncharacterized protein n=1 Tax=Psychroserpens algicola TaxID=1719034 RepID=A0ABT0H7H1_9FLAO|nr:hypothetical protein [Psychroserpens algicola]MCK8480147.1 hypothetical protein [Psychroserpens algicola]
MNLPGNLFKSAVLAFAIFWFIIISEDVIDSDTPLLMFLSCIPIFLMVTIVIIGSICPVFWLASKEHTTKQDIFKTYFPYYAIIASSACVFGIYVSNNELIAFFSSAFITTCQSWVWFAKEKN